MKPDLRYKTVEDAVMRIDTAIVKYQEIPYYCRIKDGKAKLYEMEHITENGSELLGSLTHTLDYNNLDINVEAIHIGYVNHTSLGTYYITRPPLRKQKQGTCHSNCYMANVGAMNYSPIPFKYLINGATRLSILGYFPTYRECIRKLEKTTGNSAAAFARDFAIKSISGEKFIYHDQRLIGEAVTTSFARLYPQASDSIYIMKLSAMGIGVE